MLNLPALHALSGSVCVGVCVRVSGRWAIGGVAMPHLPHGMASCWFPARRVFALVIDAVVAAAVVATVAAAAHFNGKKLNFN